MPNKMCYAQRSANRKKRARSHGPVFSGKVSEVGQHQNSQSWLQFNRQCYTVSDHICKLLTDLSLMQTSSITACSRGLQPHRALLPTSRVKMERSTQCSGQNSAKCGKRTTWVQEEGIMKGVYGARNLPSTQLNQQWEVLWPLLGEKKIMYTIFNSSFSRDWVDGLSLFSFKGLLSSSI